MNHLEQLVAEWCEYKGYFVMRNIPTHPRELDVIAHHPHKPHRVLHIETGIVTRSWQETQNTYSRKFNRGLEYIQNSFPDERYPQRKIIQFAVLYMRGEHQRIVNNEENRVFRVFSEVHLLRRIVRRLNGVNFNNNAVPEKFPLLRTIHLLVQHHDEIFPQQQ